MSSICELSDDLLVKILSLVETKDAVATCVLSKRWVSLWKLIPRLEYVIPMNATSSNFIDNFLKLSNASILETLHLKLGYECAQKEHERWVNIAVDRHVRDLELLHHRCGLTPMPFPKSLFSYKSLVVLSLQQVGISDIPSTIFLQSLKTLSLLCVKFYSGDELVTRLLSACPVLETLTVQRWLEDLVSIYTIANPSLKSLYIKQRPFGHTQIADFREYVINTPALKTLRVFDKSCRFRSLVKMPKLVNVEIQISQVDLDCLMLMGCLTSTKHLSLCLTSVRPLLVQKPYEYFCQLEYLELCVECSTDHLCLLFRHSPKLRVLKIKQRKNCDNFFKVYTQWEEPSCVPECVASSLETVEWNWYKGTKAELDAAIYILHKASHLKKMTISGKIANLTSLIDLASNLSFSQLEFVPMDHD